MIPCPASIGDAKGLDQVGTGAGFIAASCFQLNI